MASRLSRGASFNPRPRTRANDWALDTLADWVTVSIRALARGRTKGCRLLIRAPRFQSAPSHEGERLPVSSARVARRFQSAPSHEGERPYQANPSCLRRFQSAPSHEGEPERSLGIDPSFAFQSAPSHEGERTEILYATGITGFNPRPRTRANALSRLVRVRVIGFQSAPSHEGEPR